METEDAVLIRAQVCILPVWYKPEATGYLPSITGPERKSGYRCPGELLTQISEEHVCSKGTFTY